jgi:hypothetical protein
MMYIRQIETLLGCDRATAVAVFDLMYDLDCSECSDRQFNKAARQAYAELLSL